MQRGFDIIFSVLALVILAPILILIVVILRFTGEGEILYLQERIGRNRKKFKVIKFATMLKNSPTIGSRNITITNDPRVLPFGKFLRKTKINELPQLFNILKGEMSLIGPRPITHEQFLIYERHVQHTLQFIRPGLSGVGSIVFRDEEKIVSSFTKINEGYANIIAPYKGELEVWYASRKSFRSYLLLILLTIFVVFRPNSSAFWRLFPDAPKPKHIALINYFKLSD
jgi:lipopolysaccharide/colanic/teichoic acid biosynthesis glycosyltransferase